jgi:hypothetical protein
MARVFSEAAWKSDKVLGISPAEWIPEYSWLYSIALVDGTFEATPRQLWMAAYVGRPDWTPEKVGLLLDELERVGLLRRAKDENSKVWGWWVGSERFLPSKEHVDSHRYKRGRRDLFPQERRSSAGAAPEQSSAAPDSPEQRQNSAGESRLGVGVGSRFGEGKGGGVGSGAAKASENEQRQEPVKSDGGASFSNTVEPTPKQPQPQTQPQPEDFANRLDYAVACANAGVVPKTRPPRRAAALSEEEYSEEKTARAVAEFAAELAARGKQQ